MSGPAVPDVAESVASAQEPTPAPAEHVSRRGPRIWLHYSVAIASVGVAALLDWLLARPLGASFSFLLLYPAIVLAACVGGLGPGLLATLLAAMLARGIFSVPPGQFRTDEPVGITHLAVFLAGGVFISVLGGLVQRTRRQCQAERQTACRAQAALRESEQRFHSIFSQAAIGICLATVDGRMMVANRKLCDMLGYTPEELLQKTYQEITYPEDWPPQVAQARRLQAGEIDSYSMEKRYIRKDGSLVWANLTCSAIRGEHPCVVAVIEDISDRRQAQDALRESEEKFRSLAENAHAAFGIVQGTRFVYANNFFAQLSGYSVEEILTMDFYQMVHPAFRDVMMDRARRRQQGEKVPSHYEFVMITKSGTERWVDFSPAMTMYRGNPAIIGTGFDITAHKRTVAALRESESRLAEAKEVAEAASRAKDQFLAVLSHELRTPLTPAMAAASILQKDPRLPPDVREDVEMIRRNVDLEARLIDDMLDLTRIARGKLELRPQPVDVCVVLQHTAEICSADIDAKDLRLEMDLGDGACWLHADPARLQQVFWNLLSNAIKFTPAGGRIAVRRRADPQGHLVVEVSDTGVGIEPDMLPRIFDAFEQGGRPVTRQFGGLGLGLAISKALVQMHGGTISAQSEGKGMGTTFRVALPSAAREPANGHPALQAGSPDDAAARRSMSILLVEDHHDTARLLGQLLKADGHRVQIAGTVAAAFALAERDTFDLLISDLGLPDGSGLEIMRRLRAGGRPPRGIALSGYGMDEDLERSREAGFAEHLTKPITPDRLQDAIARVMATHAQPR